MSALIQQHNTRDNILNKLSVQPNRSHGITQLVWHEVPRGFMVEWQKPWKHFTNSYKIKNLWVILWSW